MRHHRDVRPLCVRNDADDEPPEVSLDAVAHAPIASSAMRRRAALLSLAACLIGVGSGIAHGDDSPDAAIAVATASRTYHVEQVTPTEPPPPTTVAPETVVPAGSGAGKRVIYSKSLQLVWAVEANEQLVRSYRVSGRMDQPNPGQYQVRSRSQYTCSSSNHNTCMRYMVRFAVGPEGDNIGFHEIPRLNGVPLQSEDRLGTPLSHGCVRQATVDAEFLWAWAPIGTTVVVIA